MSKIRSLKSLLLLVVLWTAVSVLGGCVGGAGAPVGGHADLVLMGEHIHTVDPATRGATAVAVRGQEIVEVSNPRSIRKWIGERTRTISLGDRALVPGFIDSHGHLAMVMQMLGLLNASSPPVGPMESVEDIVSALKAHIESKQIPPGEFVMGYGYDDSLLAEGRHPDRDDLDRVSTEHPIVLLHVSAHLATANSAALAKIGFDENTPDPYGGVIRRRPGTTQPNGVLEETAAHAGLAHLFEAGGQATPEQFAASVRAGLDYHASFGITTVQDGASSPAMVAGLRALAAAAPLPIDVAAFPVWGSTEQVTDVEAIGYSRAYENGVRVAGVKFVLDGSPQGRTAWMTEPYHEGPPGEAADYTAYSMVKPAFYKTQAKRLMDAGIPFLAHANGDAAIDLMIEGVEEALGGRQKDHRSVTIHAQLTRYDQLESMKRLGIVPSFFAAHPFFWGDWHRKSFGDARALQISPMGSAIELGVPFTIHNDAPVVPPDMMRLMEVAMTRKTRSGFVLGANQRLPFEEALRAVTLGGAYQYFEEDRKGSISPGKRADLVILERDPMSVPADQVSEIGIVETFARGRSVYASGD